MNRLERRARAAMSREMQATRPKQLTQLPIEEVRSKWNRPSAPPFEVWVSREFLVQLYEPRPGEGAAPAFRMSISRVTLQADGRWEAAITWDELQKAKRDVGRGDAYAVEVYPRDRDLVNDANMRHLWIFERPLDCGWFRP